MAVYLSALEHNNVPIQLREILSFTRAVTEALTAKLADMTGVSGCVLLCTCNRTELYISSQTELHPGILLCRAAEVACEPFEKAFFSYRNEDAVTHLMEVSAGLRSRIFGEDQIISQVKDAIAIARKVGAADSVLETLFRTAISAGKEARSRVRFTALPASAASRAVEVLENRLGCLQGRRAMVIGNGEMGRLSASLLNSRGCDVTVTLRTYRHGETVVPPGCRVAPYEERFAYMDGMDCLISSTASPHFIVKTEDILSLENPPRIIIDLAIPRDIQPEIGNLEGITALNVDDLDSCAPSFTTPPLVRGILKKHEENFHRWLNYRDCMPAVKELKKSVLERVRTARELEYGLDTAELLELVVDRTVELLTAGLSEQLSAESLIQCGKKIRANTTAKPVLERISV